MLYWSRSVGDSGRSLRQIDTDLPVILAMLQDAAGHLAET